ncbi:hypothetical protein OG292_00375 [Streptomyces sp. NBC_01511]|uniref:hypothetical protein n=1 Tax=Streptomyces sp. NBC_01511 TaxID=2903889 RepID=UPI0038691BF8
MTERGDPAEDRRDAGDRRLDPGARRRAVQGTTAPPSARAIIRAVRARQVLEAGIIGEFGHMWPNSA